MHDDEGTPLLIYVREQTQADDIVLSDYATINFLVAVTLSMKHPLLPVVVLAGKLLSAQLEAGQAQIV